MALNVLYVPYSTKEKSHGFKSKYDLKHKNQVILLMNTDGEKWHYLVVKSLSAFLRGITAKHEGNFYCLNCFRSYTTINRLKNIKNMKKT